jgi:hypothetical protein
MRISRIFLLFFLAACNSNDSYTTKKQQEQMRPEEKPTGTSSLLSDTVIRAQERDLYGFWSDGSTKNASFEIRADGIYAGQSAVYKYVLKEDAITIYYPAFTFKGRLKMENSELMIVSDDGKSSFKRFAN